MHNLRHQPLIKDEVADQSASIIYPAPEPPFGRYYDYAGIIGEPPAPKEQEYIDDMYLKLSEIGRQYEIVSRNPLTIARK